MFILYKQTNGMKKQINGTKKQIKGIYIWIFNFFLIILYA